MDTSEKYIKMCQQAREIQKLKTNPENGDIFYLIFDKVISQTWEKKYKEFKNYKVGDSTKSGGKCIAFDEEKQMLLFEYNTKPLKDKIFVFSDNANEFLDKDSLEYEYPSDGIANSFKLIKIWLPRQDQLQEIVDLPNENLHRSEFLLSVFNEWFRKEERTLMNKFSSFEQLWLVFLMESEYSKAWDEQSKEWKRN